MITIIPAIDIIDGKCVRLTKGDFSQKTVYREDPLEVAKEFEAAGLKRLHLVDLDGAKAGEVKNLGVLERISRSTNLIIDFSGGIKSEEILKNVFSAGAAMAAIGSLAVREPDTLKAWIKNYGAKKFLVGADVIGRKIAISGWQKESEMDLFEFLEMFIKTGILDFFCTDVSKDGMMMGPSLDLYKEIIEKYPDIRLIASGGVRDKNDIEILDTIGCTGIIIGKAFYEGKIALTEMTNPKPETRNL